MHPRMAYLLPEFPRSDHGPCRATPKLRKQWRVAAADSDSNPIFMPDPQATIRFPGFAGFTRNTPGATCFPDQAWGACYRLPHLGSLGHARYSEAIRRGARRARTGARTLRHGPQTAYGRRRLLQGTASPSSAHSATAMHPSTPRIRAPEEVTASKQSHRFPRIPQRVEKLARWESARPASQLAWPPVPRRRRPRHHDGH
jgi:hypothetical protein